MLPPPLGAPLSPYTTLFRSNPGDRGLNEVSDVVQLVSHRQVCISTWQARVADGGSKISILILRGGDPVDQQVKLGRESKDLRLAQLPGHRFEKFVDLGV